MTSKNMKSTIDLADESARTGKLAVSKAKRRKTRSEIKALKDYGRPFLELAQAMKQDSTAMKKELKSVREAFGTGRYARRDMNVAFYKKAGFYPNTANINYLKKVAGLPEATREEIVEMVVLDDLPPWLKSALSTVSSAISAGASWLKPEFAPMLSAGNQFLQSQLGTGGVSYSSVNEFPDTKTTMIPTLISKSMSMPMGTMRIEKSLFDPTRVDVRSIAYVIAADSGYQGTAHFEDVQPSATLSFFREFPIIPTDTGTAYFMINTYPTSFSTSSVSFSGFINCSNANSTYNIDTGAYTNNVNFPNPLNSSSLIDSVRPVAINVTFTTSVKTNTTFANGQVDVWHDPSYIGGLSDWATPSTNLTLENVGKRPFFQKGPITETYSQCLYNPLDYDMEPAGVVASSFQAPIVFLFSGCNTSNVQIGTVSVWVSYNVVPNASGYSSLNVTAPGVGPFTGNLMDSIYQTVPGIFIADRNTRQAIAKGLLTVEPTYSAVLEYLTSVPLPLGAK